VGEVVRKQAALGIDVVDDGEFGKPSVVTYVRERLGGLTRQEGERLSPWIRSREAISFPEFYKAQAGAVNARQALMACTGPITYRGHKELQTDLDNLKAALAGVDVTEVFVPSISPSNIEDWNKNQYYKTPEDYLHAIGEAMRQEYQAIVAAGFLVQIDDPQLVTHYVVNPTATVEQCRKWAQMHVEALNHAIRGIPREKIRYHTCYGINMGPRIHDMEAKDIIDIVLKINAGAFSFEASNPRHEHEWTVWEQAKIPDGAVLIPGVISHSTILVEHPELIAQRIARYANIVGRQNVIAGSDCGFATFAGSDEVHESIVWAKFDALGKGARIASRQLWAKKPGKRSAKAVARPAARKRPKTRKAPSRAARKVAKRR
ncbi:MAG: 5-methyltetrahydropteroyltriglutamate--homocysteine methyltransferase, partial [Alphaproteobacteria bacterium]|nr:5-methyltetrahydropteroyltriglutamate--homocysteine methyltransferase [Alphaproteobacteria bacterium]